MVKNLRNRNLSTRLLLSVCNLAMVDDNSIASSPSAISNGPADGLWELSSGIREEELYRRKRIVSFSSIVWRKEGRKEAYDRVIFDTIGLSPSTHDIGIVHGNTSNDVNTLLLQLRELLDETREMSSWATWSECAWDGEENDFLAGELCDARGRLACAIGFQEAQDIRRETVNTFRSIICDWDTTGSDVSSLGGVGNILEFDSTWEAVADFETRHGYWLMRYVEFCDCLWERRRWNELDWKIVDCVVLGRKEDYFVQGAGLFTY